VPPFLTRYLPVFTLPLIGRSINWWFYCRALRDKALDSGSLYYVPWLYPDGVAVARTIRGRGARLWLMALGSDTFHLQSRRRRHLILEACKQAEGIVCVARVLADRLADAGVPREKLHVVPNGVDTALFRPRRKEDAWRELGWGEENPHLSLRSKVDGRWSMVTPPMILFVGNLVPVKGPDVMVRAFAELVNSYSSPVINEKNNTNNQEPTTNNPLPQLLLIGEGPMRGQLERLVCALGLAGRVHFLGRRVPEDVALWMNVADCLCLSSASEGMPNVVLEARASGLPVVATPAGACPELSLDKEGLLVVKSCWPEDIAEGLREMLGRDLGSRGADSAIPAWHEQAEKILGLVGR